MECDESNALQVIYMPSCIEAAATMQACARLGIVHATVFAGFSSGALSERINDCQAKMVITMDRLNSMDFMFFHLKNCTNSMKYRLNSEKFQNFHFKA